MFFSHKTLVLKQGIRFSLVAILFITILLAGVYTDAIFTSLDKAIWQLVHWLNLQHFYQALQQNTHSKVTMRSLPTMLLYGASYCLLCLTALYFYLGQNQKFILVAGFYVSVFILCLVCIVLGKALGDVVVLYNLARRLIEMIISPLPVILFIVTFQFSKTTRSLMAK